MLLSPFVDHFVDLFCDSMEKLMTALAELINSLTTNDGYTNTPLDDVRLFRSESATGRQAYVYEPCICIVAQGKKVGHVHGTSVRYDANNYLVNTMLAPIACESFGTPTEPLLGLSIAVNISTVYDLVNQLSNVTLERDLPPISDTAEMEPALQDAVIRLVRALHDDTEARILGPSLIREILFRVLCGSQGCMLLALANRHGAYARVAQIIDILHRDYTTTIDIDSLSATADMSASTFHRTFKKLCGDSPLQYVKKLRLEEARRLIVDDGIQINRASERVGYESASQFSREFKRHFGCTPAAMANSQGILLEQS